MIYKIDFLSGLHFGYGARQINHGMIGKARLWYVSIPTPTGGRMVYGKTKKAVWRKAVQKYNWVPRGQFKFTPYTPAPLDDHTADAIRYAIGSRLFCVRPPHIIVKTTA